MSKKDARYDMLTCINDVMNKYRFRFLGTEEHHEVPKTEVSLLIQEVALRFYRMHISIPGRVAGFLKGMQMKLWHSKGLNAKVTTRQMNVLLQLAGEQ